MYPQQNDVRNLLDLSGFWEFELDPQGMGEKDGWCNGLSAPRLIAVPGSWNDQFDDAHDYFGPAWYVREFYVPQGWQGQRVMLRVGSANYAARVWLNGTHVGAHQGGHLPFDLDLTDGVRRDGPNTLAIEVENLLRPDRVPPGNVPGGMNAMMRSYPAANFDFFPYAGLHRAVLLYSLPAAHVTDVTVTTTIEGTAGKVQVAVTATGGAKHGKVQVAGEQGKFSSDLVFTNGAAQATVTIPAVRLWSTDDPYLYMLTVTLTEHEQVVDRYALEIGVRTIEVRGDQLLLNGKPVFLKGFGRHEDFFISGRGLNLPVIVHDYALLKWVGANSFRTSHYPYSEEDMRMADRNGILVIDEIPAVGLFFTGSEQEMATRLAQCRQQVRELIGRDKNHPSVIMWSVANEPMPGGGLISALGGLPPQPDPAGASFLGQLTTLAHELDATRPATFVAVHGTPAEWYALGDVVCINRYYGWYSQGGRLEEGRSLLAKELDALHAALHKPMMVTEFGADTLPGNHQQPPLMWSEEYQAEFIKGYLDVAEQRDFVVGMHVWNLADFQTGQGIMRAGSLNHKGVFTRTRQPKMAAHMLHERWGKR